MLQLDYLQTLTTTSVSPSVTLQNWILDMTNPTKHLFLWGSFHKESTFTPFNPKFKFSLIFYIRLYKENIKIKFTTFCHTLLYLLRSILLFRCLLCLVFHNNNIRRIHIIVIMIPYLIIYQLMTIIQDKVPVLPPQKQTSRLLPEPPLLDNLTSLRVFDLVWQLIVTLLLIEVVTLWDCKLMRGSTFVLVVHGGREGLEHVHLLEMGMRILLNYGLMVLL